MKKVKPGKIIGFVVLAIIAILLLVIAYVYFFLPGIPVKDIKVTSTPERIERGKYLANHVMACMDCHSTRDWSKFSGPITPGTEGKGGEAFDQKMGFPGVFYSANITPFNISSMSDGELYRVITSGVTRKNRPIFPVMPYLNYGKMDTEDIYSVIAYIRTLPSINSQPPPSKPDFPMNLILHMIPTKASPQNKPPASDSVKYGEYLVNASACIECHTPVNKGQIIKELAFSGGRELKMPFGILRSANLTPDKESGLGNYTKEQFINRIKAYDLAVYVPQDVRENEFNSIMPWTMYAGMTRDDLGYIYIYLHSLKPIKNQVTKFTPLK